MGVSSGLRVASGPLAGPSSVVAVGDILYRVLCVWNREGTGRKETTMMNREDATRAVAA